MLHSLIINIQDTSSSNNEFTSAIIGFVGVLVGSIISYYFNRKLSIENSKAAFAIQRKNLIFSKIYKELIHIKVSLKSLPEKCFYFDLLTNIDNGTPRHYRGDDTFYFGQKTYPRATFNLWGEIKNDIRNSHIPDKLRMNMDLLEGYVAKYLSARVQAHTDIEDMKKRRTKESGISFAIDDNLFYFDLTVNEIVAENISKHHVHSNVSPAVLEEMETVVSLIKDLPSLKSAQANFIEIKKQLDVTFSYLDDLIKRIVDKYEFGQTI